MRIKWSEAEAMVRAWRRRIGAGSDVDLSSVARSLGISLQDAEALLMSVRSAPKRLFTDRGGILSAGLAAAACVALALLALSQTNFRFPVPGTRAVAVRVTAAPVAEPDAQSFSVQLAPAPPAAPCPPEIVCMRSTTMLKAKREQEIVIHEVRKAVKEISKATSEL